MSDNSPEYDIDFIKKYNIEEKRGEIDSLYKSYNAIISKNGDISDLQNRIQAITLKQEDYFKYCSEAFVETLNDLNDEKHFLYFGEIADVCIENGLNCLTSTQLLSSFEENNEQYVESKIEQQQLIDKTVSSVVNFIQSIDTTLSSKEGETGEDEINVYGDNYAIGGLIENIRSSDATKNLYDDVVVEHAKNFLPSDKSILDTDYYGVCDVFKEITDSQNRSLTDINAILDNNLNSDVLNANELKTLFGLSILSDTLKQPILDDYAVYASSYHKFDTNSSELEKDLYDMAVLSKNAKNHTSISDAVREMVSIDKDVFNSSDLSKFYGEVNLESKAPLLDISKNLYQRTINDNLNLGLDVPKETSDYLISITSLDLVNDYGISSEINFVNEVISKRCNNDSKSTADFLKNTVNEYIDSTEENNNYKPEIAEGLLRRIGELQITTNGNIFSTDNKLSILDDVKNKSYTASPEDQRMVERVIKDVLVSATDISVKKKVETLTNYLKNFDENNENVSEYKNAISQLLTNTEGVDKQTLIDNFKELDKLIDEDEDNEDYKKAMETIANNDKLTPEDVMTALEECKSSTAEKLLQNRIEKMVKDGRLDSDPFALNVPLIKSNNEIDKISLNAGNWYEKILSYPFENSNIVDIISDYGWMNNDVWKSSSKNKDSYSKLNNIPYCYVTEYKQLYNSSITNILTSLIGAASSSRHIMSNAGDMISNITSQFGNIGQQLLSGVSKYTSTLVDDGTKEEIKEKFNTFTSSVKKGHNYVKEQLKNITGNVVQLGNGPISSISASELLYPYRLMYILDKTDKKYCFPMLDKSASSFNVSNKMEEKEEGVGSFLLGNKITSTLANVTNALMGVSQDLANIAPFFENAQSAGISSNQIRQYNIERSKFFSYPTDGDSIDVNFMLFNTVKKDIWRKHYRFILGFVLRNLPFKQDTVSYYPPLFYDVIVPGIKRCPFCYVESIGVNPLGLIRTLKLSGRELNFNDNKKIRDDASFSVNVPEAWQINIKFKSLIGFSSNQILSGLVDSPITGNLA